MTNPEELNLKTLCDGCLDIARDAGEKILSIYNSTYDIKEKEDRTPLTTADLAAHHTILAGLQKLTPDIPILSEESTAIPFEERMTWTRYWLVDPLDGTREFIKRNGEFTVNIALIENNRSILGVIQVPVTGVEYCAYRDGGAYKLEAGTQLQPIKARALPKGKITIAGSRSHGSEEMQVFLAKLGDIETISMGSSLKSCLVAEGKADLYPRLGLTSEWDTAAAHCIVEESGGKVTRTDMSELLYNTKESLLNPHFFVIGNNEENWSAYLDNEA